MRYVIIGSGIIGSAIALDLSRRKAGTVTVLEKEPGFGMHASGRNSGVIHSGINQKPGSFKARMCVEGSRRLREFCKRHEVPMNVCGTLVVARNTAELDSIEALKKMGEECGVEGLRILSRSELKEREPLAKGHAALLSPSGAVVDSALLLDAVIHEAKRHGVHFHLSQKAIDIRGKTVHTPAGKFEADYIINCAGLYADKIAHLMDVGKEYRIIPFRGEYMEVRDCPVRTMIYQPPDLRFPFLSIHLTRETDGRVLAGPSAVLAFGREAYRKEWNLPEMIAMAMSQQFLRLCASPAFLQTATANAKTSLSKKHFLSQVQSLYEGIEERHLTPYRAGIRAQMVDLNGRLVDDMMVRHERHSTHVLNAVSPGMTCSLAFAELITDDILKRQK